MLYIRGDTFTMGPDTSAGDAPAHPVRLSDFCLDRTEVTVARYRACVMAGRCDVPTLAASTYGMPESATYPITGVTWAMASSFCLWTGGDLPTEAQWEFAARGTDGRLFPWGTTYNGDEGICWGHAIESPCPAGTSAGDRSPFGAMDMGANVSEWTRDAFGAYPPASAGVVTDPLGGSQPNTRIARGSGSLTGNPNNMRTTLRRPMSPTVVQAGLGLRCAHAP